MSPRDKSKSSKTGSPQGGSGFVFKDRSGRLHAPKAKVGEHGHGHGQEPAEAPPTAVKRPVRAGARSPESRGPIPLPDADQIRFKGKRPPPTGDRSAPPRAGRPARSERAPAPWGNESHTTEGGESGKGGPKGKRPGFTKAATYGKGREGGLKFGKRAPRGEDQPLSRAAHPREPAAIIRGDRSFGRGQDRSPGRGAKKEVRGRGNERPSEREGNRDRGANRGRESKEGRGGPRAGKPRAPGLQFAGYKEFKATVDKNRKGFGFLIFENRKLEDAFIPPRNAEQFFHGDRVEVTMNSRGDVSGVKILQHRFREIVGRYSPHPSPREGRAGYVVYERKKAREEVLIPEVSQKVNAGEWVRVELDFHDQDDTAPHRVTGRIAEVYGDNLPPSADVGMIAAEYNLIEVHPPESEAEAKTFKLDLDLTHREDLRDVSFITIDGETARDFDDAIYVERAQDGFVLWVAIADVSHYVTPGSPIDLDAHSRGTSVYFPERAFHMLPRALSENLCSLRPDEPRLTMVSRMEYDKNGERTATRLMEAIILSKRRATYNEIQKEWEEQGKNPDWEYAPHFALYQLIRKKRATRGSIDFDLPEANLVVKPTGEVESITLRERLDAHRLIEEFMISANEAVTEWAMEREWPFIYRVHEEPAEQSLVKFQKLAAHMGVAFSLDGPSETLPQRLNAMVAALEGHPAQTMLNMALLRSMKQAIYSSTHGIHFGLASQAYTHFTSPIRRYPDLLVHRMLRMALRTDLGKLKAPTDAQRSRMEQDLADAAEHCSYRERLASDAERESIKLKQVRAVIPHLGKEFEGKVVGMIEAGLFVSINDPYVEGMVSTDSMTDDFYQFDDEKMVFFGKRKRKAYRIGDPVKVTPVRADVEARQIDFAMADKEPKAPHKPSTTESEW